MPWTINELGESVWQEPNQAANQSIMDWANQYKAQRWGGEGFIDDGYNIPGVGKVTDVFPWADFQNYRPNDSVTPEAYRSNMFNNGQVIDTPAGQLFVGTANPNASDMSRPNGREWIGAMLPGLLAGGIGTAGSAAGFGFGGLGGASGALGGTGTGGALSALESGLGAYTNFGSGLAGAGGAGAGGLGALNSFDTGAMADILGTNIGGAGAGGASGLDAIMAGWNPAGDLSEYAGYTAANTVPTGAAGAGAGAATNTAASTLSQFLKDKLGINLDPSTVSMLGTGLSTLLGAYGSNKQANSLTDIANQARGDRLPALNAFNSALADPNSWYQSAPAMGAVDSVLRKLSANVGNPALNPGALSQAAAYNLGGYNDYLRTTGNLGLSGQDSTIRAQTNAALGDTNFYNALGSGIGSLTSNQPNVNGLLEQLLKRSGFGLS